MRLQKEEEEKKRFSVVARIFFFNIDQQKSRSKRGFIMEGSLKRIFPSVGDNRK